VPPCHPASLVVGLCAMPNELGVDYVAHGEWVRSVHLLRRMHPPRQVARHGPTFPRDVCLPTVVSAVSQWSLPSQLAVYPLPSQRRPVSQTRANADRHHCTGGASSFRFVRAVPCVYCDNHLDIVCKSSSSEWVSLRLVRRVSRCKTCRVGRGNEWLARLSPSNT
jgi:hypothetical protein